MITLITFTSSLTILFLSAKIYRDLQSKIAEVEELREKYKSNNATPVMGMSLDKTNIVVDADLL
jgi:hypothetical protein